MTGHEARDEIAQIVKTVSTTWGGPAMGEFENDPPIRKHFAIADALIAAGYRRHPAPEIPTIEQWAATLRAERERQIAKGYDGEHDHEHGVKHLVTWAIEYGRRGETVKSHALMLAVLDLLAKHPEPEITDEAARLKDVIAEARDPHGGDHWTEYRSAVVYLDEQGGVQGVRETHQTRRLAEAALDDARNEWPELDHDDDEPSVARAIVSRLRRDPGEWFVSLLDLDGQETV